MGLVGLPGTPGTLVKRSGTGRSYRYRVCQGAGGKQFEEFVGRDSDEAAHAQAADEVAFAKWVSDRVCNLRRLEFLRRQGHRTGARCNAQRGALPVGPVRRRDAGRQAPPACGWTY